MADLPALPGGATLDSDAGGLPPLPDGATLDKSTGDATSLVKRPGLLAGAGKSFLSAAGEGLGQITRAAARIPGLPTAAHDTLEQLGTRAEQRAAEVRPADFEAEHPIVSEVTRGAGGLLYPAAASVLPVVGKPLGVAAFAGQGQQSARENEQAKVANLKDEDLAKIPRYTELLQSGLSPQDARAKFSEEATQHAANVGGLSGAALGLIPGSKLAEPLERGVSNVLGKIVRPGVADVVGHGVGEAGLFGGINVATQAVQNATDAVPTPIGEGLVDAGLSGLTPGFLLGAGRRLLTRPGTASPAPAPVAEPAAPAIDPNAGPISRAAASAAPAPAQSPASTLAADAERVAAAAPPKGPLESVARAVTPAHQSEQAPPLPTVPWVNAETGEFRKPTDEEVKDQFHVLFDRAQGSNGSTRTGTLPNAQMAEEWGVPLKQLKELRTQAVVERKAGFKAGDQRTQPPQQPENSNAVEKGQEPTRSVEQHQDGNGGGQAPEAGGGDRTEHVARPVEQSAPAQGTAAGDGRGEPSTSAEHVASILATTNREEGTQRQGSGQDAHGSAPHDVAAELDSTRLAQLRDKKRAGELTPHENDEYMHQLELDNQTADVAGEKVPGVLNTNGRKELERTGRMKPFQLRSDVDDFKRVNDTGGHGFGDQVLALKMRAYREAFGPGNSWRDGGDEFGGHADTQEQLDKAKEHIANVMSNATLSFTDKNGATITRKGFGVSFGSGRHTDPVQAREVADRALFEDKQARKAAGKRIGERRADDHPAVEPVAAESSGSAAADHQRVDGSAAEPGARSEQGIVSDHPADGERPSAGEVNAAANDGNGIAAAPTESGSAVGTGRARTAGADARSAKTGAGKDAGNGAQSVSTSVGARRVDRTHDVPLLGSSGKDGTVYIDKDWDPIIKDGLLKGLDRTPFLVEHEAVEAAKEKEGVDYSKSHHDHAEPAEHKALLDHLKLKAGTPEANKAIEAYENSYKEDLRAAAGKNATNVPADLITKPYEHPHNAAQRKLLGEVEKAQENPVDEAARTAAAHPESPHPEPTEAQKEAGNYAKGHINLHGLDISIENPAGTSRRPEWPPLANHYGYIRRTEGADGDHVDAFLGPHAEDASKPVFVIDQKNPKTGRFDEHKVMLGFSSGKDARRAYKANYHKGWNGLSDITQMSIDQFKEWVKNGDTTKPAAQAKTTGEVSNGSERAGVESVRAAGEAATPADIGANAHGRDSGTEKPAVPTATKTGESTEVAASRTGKMASPKTIEMLERRFGDEIRAQFGKDPSALTHSEARYLAGFKSADELRAAKAARERDERLRAKGVREEAQPVAAAEKEPSKSPPDAGISVSAEANTAETEVKWGALSDAERQTYLRDAGVGVGPAKKLAMRSLDKIPLGARDAITERLNAKPVEAAADRARAAEPKPAAGAVPITDFGEKIEGARKHYAESYAQSVKDGEKLPTAEHPLSKTWPEPDYAKLVEGGTDPRIASIVHAMRDEIPQKPVKSWRLSGWVKQVEMLRDMSSKLLGGDITPEQFDKALGKPEFAGLAKYLRGRADLYDAVGHDTSLKGIRLQEHHYSLYKGEKNVTKWVVERQAKATAFSNWPQELAVGNTKAEAVDAFKAKVGELGDKSDIPRKAPLIIYSRKFKKGEFIIGVKLRGGDALDLKSFTDVKEARQYLTDHRDGLTAQLAKAREIPSERKQRNEPRVGADYRNGADVTSDQFNDAFGFRGVQFGNYVEGARRQADLNQAYDALHDLAGVMGVPARALSLNGQLGLAFGARGHGGKNPAAAHYESRRAVINLTKNAGAGSLAHEWWHSLDNYFGKLRGQPDSFLSATAQKAGPAGDVRQEMLKAYANVTDTVRKTGVLERSQALDKLRSKDYWSTDHELTARAFESYVIAKLEDQSAGNDYLANVVSETAFGREGKYPYPTAAEIPAIRAAFDDFFNTIESREGDGGKVALFRRGVDEGAGQRAQDVRAQVADITKDFGENAPRVRVVDTPEQLPATAKRDPGYKQARGYYDNNDTAYIIASAHADRASVERSVLHEVIGHHGIEKILNEHVPGGWNRLVSDISALRDSGEGSPAMRAVLADVDRRYPGADDKTKAKETLAVMAERGVRNGLIARAVAAIRAFLRKNFARFAEMKMSERDLARLLAKSDEYIHAGETNAQRHAAVQSMAFSRKADTFYSALHDALTKAQGAPKKGGEALKQWLDGAQRRGEFKGSERQWLGVDQWLDTHPDATRAELEQFVQSHAVDVRAVKLGTANPADLKTAREILKRNDNLGYDHVGEALSDLRADYQTNGPDAVDRLDIPDDDRAALHDAMRGDARSTKFAAYTLPAGENYREHLLTLPARPAGETIPDGPRGWGDTGGGTRMTDTNNFRSSHFDEPNILAHVRMNDRTTADGAKALHIEEIQSDWHQRGRRSGYQSPYTAEENELRALNAKTFGNEGLSDADERRRAELDSKIGDQLRRKAAGQVVPDAPLKNTEEWAMLGFKHALREAIETGKDKVTWTTGEQQAERYDLSKHVDQITVRPRDDGKKHVTIALADRGGGGHFVDLGVNSDGKVATTDKNSVELGGKHLSDIVGKDLSEKIMDSERATLSGNDLRIGGEGMKGFYDKILPKAVEKYVKQWGGKVGTSKLDTGKEKPASWESIDTATQKRQGEVTVHSVDITPEMRDAVQEGQPLFSKDAEPFQKPLASVDAIDDIMKEPNSEPAFERAKQWLRGKAEDLRPAVLGAFQRRWITQLMDETKALRGYGKQFDERVQRMEADRNQLLTGAPDAAENPGKMLKRGAAALSEDLSKYARPPGVAGWPGRENPELKTFKDIVYGSTLHEVDPSKPFEALKMEDSRGNLIDASPRNIKERIKELKGQMRGRPGDAKSFLMEQVRHLRSIPARNRKREAAYNELAAKFQQLSEKGKTQFLQGRDWHSEMRDETEKAIIEKVEAVGRDVAARGGGDLAKQYSRQAVQRMRVMFEQNRLEGAYAPLTRHGDFYLSMSDADGKDAFMMLETAGEQAAAEKKFREAGFTIDSLGRRDRNATAKQAPSGTFIAKLIGDLRQAGAPEKVLDGVYQEFLRAMPDVSMRKHSIHRQGTPGFSTDIVRAFSNTAYHGAYQLARLRHGYELSSIADAATQALDNFRRSQFANAHDVSKADALLGELKQRLDLIQNPKNTQVANKVNALGFFMNLAGSPASAIVNLTQNAQVTLPVLAAHHGWGKAPRELAAAVGAALRTGGNIHRTLTDPIEKQAYNVLRARGDIDKTQTHTLAGLAEGDALRSNPLQAKVMNGLAFMFQRAEMINREAAGVAAFRLEYAKSKDFQQSVQYASDIINGTHFDYGASNRPRLMQGNTARIALQFKNYSASMTWTMYKNLLDSFKGETPEVRRVARRTFTGIMGMTALMAGTFGLPMINVARVVANAANAAFGDDDDFDFDTEYRKFLEEHLGTGAGKVVADGAVNPLGGQFSTRVSLANLWLQEQDKDLEGSDEYHRYVDAVLGPVFGGVFKNYFLAKKMYADGHTERATELLMPKFAKDAMKALRYEKEGVNSLRGDPIVPDITTGEEFTQLLGFTPTRVADQQRENAVISNAQHNIGERRVRLMNAYAMALHAGADTDTVVSQIQRFNTQYPQKAIDARALGASLRSRARQAAQAVHGISVDKKLRSKLIDEFAAQPPAQ